MLYPHLTHDVKVEMKPKNKLEQDLYSCDPGPDASIVAYVSKMFAVKHSELPENKRKAMTAEEMRARGREAREARLAAGGDAGPIPLATTPSTETKGTEPSPNELVEEDETLLGFSRLYSGTISRSTKLYAILPKYNAALPSSHPSNAKHLAVVEVTALYVMMGRELVPVEEVKAGNVFAIAGLEGTVWRNATLCAPNRGHEGTLSLEQADADKDCLVNLAGVSNQVCGSCR